MKIKKISISILIITAFASCSLFDKEVKSSVVARVNNHYLTTEDLAKQISDKLTPEDSSVAARAYIQNWATDKLLLDRAKLNLTESQQQIYKDLALTYEEQLLKKAYKDALIERELKEEIESTEVEGYYSTNKSNFKLNEELVQLRYLEIGKKNKSLKDIKTQFKRFNPEDMLSLQEKSLELKTLSLNDSIWVRARDVFKELKENKGIDIEVVKLLIEDRFFEFDTNNDEDLLLVYIKSVLKRNEQAPLSYVKPTIEQILLNRKKINVAKKIEKEITKDATRNNEFEVY